MNKRKRKKKKQTKKKQKESAQNKDDFRPFTNDFVFAMVMGDPDICKGIVELLLPNEEIGEVKIATADNFLPDKAKEPEVVPQASLDFGKDMRGVRFDAYVKTANEWIDIEMQTTNKHDIEKRSRYYQVLMDTDCLEKGSKFKDLKTTYVVFICTFDYFSLDEPMYVVESYIRKNNLHFDDGTSKILLNTKCSPDKVPEKLRAFYAYINDPTKVGSKLIEGIDERVKEYNTKEWREKFVTLEYMIAEAKEEGLEQGRTEGIEQGRTEGEASGRAEREIEMARAMKNKGYSNDEISELTGLPEEDIEKL